MITYIYILSHLIYFTQGKRKSSEKILLETNVCICPLETWKPHGLLLNSQLQPWQYVGYRRKLPLIQDGTTMSPWLGEFLSWKSRTQEWSQHIKNSIMFLSKPHMVQEIVKVSRKETIIPFLLKKKKLPGSFSQWKINDIAEYLGLNLKDKWDRRLFES